MVDISSFRKMINNRSFNLQDAFIILLVSFFSGSLIFFLSIPYMTSNISIKNVKSPFNELVFNISVLQTCMDHYIEQSKQKYDGSYVADGFTKPIILTKINKCKQTSQILDDDDIKFKSIKNNSEVLYGLYVTISVLSVIFLLTYIHGNTKIYKFVAMLLLLLILATFISLIFFINTSYIDINNKYYFEFTQGSIITLVIFGIMILLLSYILYK
jgi:hypothetical protein